MSQALELYSRIQNPIEAIERIGKFFASSAMFGCERIEQGQVLAMECLATGKPPSVIARTYHIMDGKLSKKALAALAEFRAMGGKHKWVKDGSDGKEAELHLTHDGNTIVSKFSIEDAKRLGVSFKSSKGNDTNWTKSPGNMLRARCISNGVAMLAPEIYAGDVEDEESPSTPATVEPLLKSAHAPVVPDTTPQPEPKTVVADVEVVSAPTVEAPVATPALTPTATLNEQGRLDVETTLKVQAAIGEHNAEKALAWLQGRGKIKGTDWQTVPASTATNILNNPKKFIEVIGGVPF
jgi:hypothetical protein